MAQKHAERRDSAGFTLVEMLVATVLATIVLLGIFNLVTNMATSEVKNMRSATVTAWSLAGINAMNSDIAGSSMLAYPASGGAADFLVVCSNWSSMMNTTGGSTMGPGVQKALYYCFDTTDPAPLGNSILRKEVDGAGCPTAPMSPCTSANYGGNSVVVSGVYRDAANDPIFYTEPNPQIPNAVRLRYSVGNPAANATSAGSNGGTVLGTAVSIPYNTEIILED